MQDDLDTSPPTESEHTVLLGRVPRPIPQEALQLAVEEGIAELRKDALRYREFLSAEVRRWRREDKGWSIDQVLEHLVLSSELYLRKLDPVVKAAKRPGHPDLLWRPSFFGGMLVHSLKSPRRLPAPKAFAPRPEARPMVLEAFLTNLESIEAQVDSASRLDWTRTKISSPVTRFFRLNLGDVFSVLVVHAERHFRQIARLWDEARPGFKAR